jgi:hypothetical protein
VATPAAFCSPSDSAYAPILESVPRQPPAYVRPKLFKDLRRHIHSQLHRELCRGVAGVSVIRIIGLRKRRGARIAKNFRVVELRMTGIGVRPENLTDRVAEPRPFVADPAPEVTRTLMEKSWKDSLGHVVANDEIAVSGAEIPAVSCHSSAERRVCARQLC